MSESKKYAQGGIGRVPSNINAGLLVDFNHPEWANLKNSSELLQKSAIMFALSLIPTARRAAAAMREFGRSIKENNMSYSRVGKEFCGREFSARMRLEKENAYRQQHGRLPGSRSTARLRKKRKDLVDRNEN